MSRVLQEGLPRSVPERISRIPVELKVTQAVLVFRRMGEETEKVMLRTEQLGLEDVVGIFGQMRDVIGVSLYRVAEGTFYHNGRPVRVSTDANGFDSTGIAFIDGQVLTREELEASRKLRSTVHAEVWPFIELADHVVRARDNTVWPFYKDRDTVVSSNPQNAKQERKIT